MSDDKAESGGVVTRFAPSPTGYLHIGGARTALFNWLFARHHGGRFLLRIEDTDRARSTPEATAAIFAGMEWLGLDWDGEAVSQLSRIERHGEVVEAMLAAGTAYRCWASKEEIDAFREQAKAEGRPPLFRSPWRDASEPGEGPYAVRLKAPREGQVTVADAVQGEVTWAAEQLDDLILMRSDGTPTYMLAVVVDDHDMGVTHVIRGDDHLTNAARQSLIYRAMGWDVPVFAHIPLIHGPDGAKLSKRHGALGVEEYAAMGYLPEAMRNYLARLGWSHGDDEFFTTEQAIAWFGLGSVGRSPARFDFAKLENLNGQHMRAAADDHLVNALDRFRVHRGTAPLDEASRARLLAAMPGLKERAKTLIELEDLAYYLLAARPLEPDVKAAKLLDGNARALLARLAARLKDVQRFDTAGLEETIRDFAEAEQLKLGKVAQPLRAALTARAVSPGVFDVMETLGREETLARLEDVI
ncbi:glutamate--tRNA ligase [Paralimibaculum aggregatum]|uniref:Glutamate--tRNA ligase n=1 Tax=Paralimibaculum aggregatum TaxID=3036245 RepID=A0ABQ6LMI9_9RHOB|nr:glutamate--tRNA ligase [Limibaculum sp. NKW23]GMG83666.1 glutamate--tRNA ligase [Limibaculum sp. NKW23]